MLTVQFTWLNPETKSAGKQSTGAMKTTGSMFIGVSPEFEMALYTVCLFKLEKKEGKEKFNVSLGGEKMVIDIRRNGEGQILSCFPRM